MGPISQGVSLLGKPQYPPALLTDRNWTPHYAPAPGSPEPSLLFSFPAADFWVSLESHHTCVVRSQSTLWNRFVQIQEMPILCILTYRIFSSVSSHSGSLNLKILCLLLSKVATFCLNSILRCSERDGKCLQGKVWWMGLNEVHWLLPLFKGSCPSSFWLCLFDLWCLVYNCY